MENFTPYNTEDYTKQELDDLNWEWQERAEDLELELYSDEYDFQLKRFSDEVSRRHKEGE